MTDTFHIRKLNGKRLVIDLDGTLCKQVRSDMYQHARPIADVIKKVNSFYDAGWHVTVFTARGMATYGDRQTARDVHGEMTERWLRDNGVKHDELVFGKPAGDIYVDDRGLTPQFFVEMEVPK